MSEEYYGKHCIEEDHLTVIKDLMTANFNLETERDHLFEVLLGRAITENDRPLDILSEVKPSRKDLEDRCVVLKAEVERLKLLQPLCTHLSTDKLMAENKVLRDAAASISNKYRRLEEREEAWQTMCEKFAGGAGDIMFGHIPHEPESFGGFVENLIEQIDNKT